MNYLDLPRLFPQFYKTHSTKKIPKALSHAKALHFIWIGNKDLPKELRKNLAYYASEMRKLSGLTFLWMDRKTISREMGKWLQENRIERIDVDPIFGSPKRMSTFVYYRAALASIPVNFGIASDLLRYEIINRFGGAYLDCDIRPCEIEIEKLFERPGCFAAGYCEKRKSARSDIFYSPPKSPVLAEFGRLVERNFQTKIWNKRLSYTRPYLLHFTVLTTGPLVFDEAVQSSKEVVYIRADVEGSSLTWVYDHTKRTRQPLSRVHHDLLLNLIYMPKILDLEKYQWKGKEAIEMVERILKLQPQFLKGVDRVFISDPKMYAEIQAMMGKGVVWNEHAALKFAYLRKAEDLIRFLVQKRGADPMKAAFSDVGHYEWLENP